MPLNIHVDLEFILLAGTLVTGFVWLLDRYLLRSRRAAKAEDRDTGDRDPWYIELCISFFPILLIVLVLRSFVAEPFRIPSGSMMPTLLHGDFILVNKFSYGVRLPVLHAKVLDTGAPQRGDVAVFRFPRNPAQDYIKRIIGLPGDLIEYRDKTVFVNNRPMLQERTGVYEGLGANSVMNGIPMYREDLQVLSHDVLIRSPKYNAPMAEYVPDGHYFVMGDNRDHSSDSRSWGFVPEKNLVGRAFLVWMNWDYAGKQFNFERIGKKII
ncbi:MAG: signal peptidase I [Gammaproteobacteria bacterium]|nr:signal peptidase I [Gammaproteobacteria bacterium]